MAFWRMAYGLWRMAYRLWHGAPSTEHVE
jgi:hypothetical protein